MNTSFALLDIALTRTNAALAPSMDVTAQPITPPEVDWRRVWGGMRYSQRRNMECAFTQTLLMICYGKPADAALCAREAAHIARLAYNMEINRLAGTAPGLADAGSISQASLAVLTTGGAL